MEKLQYNDLLQAGVHFGHLKKKWNPKMLPYIFMERKGIHIIDLNKTLDCLEEAAAALKQVAKSGKKILFVATKKQAKEIVAEAAQRVNMPYVTERWLGGMLTNFSTIRKSIKKLQSIDKMLNDGTATNITKKEKLMMSREKAKLEKVLGGIANLNRLPATIVLVDIMNEHIALAEAKRLNIQTVAMVDTNSNPNEVDFPIPSNDDATKSIAIITAYLTNAIMEGLNEQQTSRAEQEEGADEAPEAAGETGNETEEEKEAGRKRRAAGTRPEGGDGRKRVRTCGTRPKA